MALVSRCSSRSVLFVRNFPQIQRFSQNFRNANRSPRTYVQTLCIIGGGVTAFVAANLMKSKSVQALNMKKMRDGTDDDKYVQLTSRERRFIKFSSVEYNGQLFMTPLDFLDSVVEQEPRPRLKRRSLTNTDIESYKDVTPPLSKGTPQMFRSLRDRGIISYTEYLFLLSILTKPQSGFRIAFNMFDTDGNQRVDKNEFLVIQTILGGTLLDNDYNDETLKFITRLVPEHQAKLLFAKSKERQQQTKKPLMEKIFSGVWKTKRGFQDKDDSKDREIYVNDEEGLQRKHKVDTTLQIHLFGKTGTQDLKYEGFYKFMDNLQTEVLQLEFSEFSKGNIAITEVDFAKILLRYTYLDTNEYDSFLERLLNRVKKEKGILFEEFRDFCRFLNNLDDFTIAMRMYTLADRAISKEEFSRAVKVSTGLTLAPHVVDTVFAIFDADGDGLLSFKEFIAIMKDRLHRGFKTNVKGWRQIKQCVRDEMSPLRIAERY